MIGLDGWAAVSDRVLAAQRMDDSFLPLRESAAHLTTRWGVTTSSKGMSMVTLRRVLHSEALCFTSDAG